MPPQTVHRDKDAAKAAQLHAAFAARFQADFASAAWANPAAAKPEFVLLEDDGEVTTRFQLVRYAVACVRHLGCPPSPRRPFASCCRRLA
jgi:hypothetical protein